MYKCPHDFSKFNLDEYLSHYSCSFGLIHPDWPFLESCVKKETLESLFNYVEKSLSLEKHEKMRIFRRRLSRRQIKALIDVFVDEVKEFKNIIGTEGEAIHEIALKAEKGWHVILPRLVLGPQHGSKDKMKVLHQMMTEGRPRPPELYLN